MVSNLKCAEKAAKIAYEACFSFMLAKYIYVI